MDVAQTQLGKLRGVRKGNVTAWLGVPYAQPPLGPLRFRAPASVEPWTGERDATRFSAAAPQLMPDSPVVEPMVSKCGTSEDCLYLNIWSPAPDGARRPVLVWIHGGAFMMGTGATYDGADLATTGDIVVVTINYRLGPLGFVAFGALWNDDRFEANVGLLDQRAAVAWVRDHIAAFGGDPERVTVAGESAGSVSVSLMMLEEAPLFRGMIAQSGSVSLVATRDRARAHAQQYADELGLTATTAGRLLELPAERLAAAHQAVTLASPGEVTTRPYLDGRVLPGTVEELFHRPLAPVRMLLGSNRDEATLFALLKLMPTEPTEVEAHVRARLPANRLEALFAAYPRDRAGMLRLAGDAVFGNPMIHFAERQRAATWMYRFDWATPAFGGFLGAMHALELFLLWMSLDRRGVQLVLGGPPSPELRALAERMKRFWITFVREGDPGADWPRYELTRRTSRVFDLEDRLVDDLDAERRLAWHGLDSVDS